MFSHYTLTDRGFETDFREGRFDPALFDHEAHLRLAWIHIRRYGVEEAVENICTQLRAFTARVGAADKYNHTLTIAAVRTVYHFMQKSRKNNFRDFMQEFPRLRTHFRDLIFAHYSFNVFQSAEARQSWIEPDIIPYT